MLPSAYSEGLQYIGPVGDEAPSNQPPAIPTGRQPQAHGPGRLTTGPIQGGERYERISLTSPGRVTLTSIGIRFTAVRATAKDYRGWFDSSSPALNRIWYDGAYTTQFDELPAQTVPWAWRVVRGGLVNNAGLGGIVNQGVGWTNYTMSFDTHVIANEAGWLVRASSRRRDICSSSVTTWTTGPRRTLFESFPSVRPVYRSSTTWSCLRRWCLAAGTTSAPWSTGRTSRHHSTGIESRGSRPPPCPLVPTTTTPVHAGSSSIRARRHSSVISTSWDRTTPRCTRTRWLELPRSTTSRVPPSAPATSSRSSWTERNGTGLSGAATSVSRDQMSSTPRQLTTM